MTSQRSFLSLSFEGSIQFVYIRNSAAYRAALYFLPFSFCFSFAVVRESSSFVLARAKTSPNGEMGKGRWREGLSICKMLLEEIGKHQSINQTPKRTARGNKRCEKVFAGLFFFSTLPPQYIPRRRGKEKRAGPSVGVDPVNSICTLWCEENSTADSWLHTFPICYRGGRFI